MLVVALLQLMKMDRRAIELYKKNISDEINELDQLWASNLEDMPDIDILACDFYRVFYRDLSIAGRKQKKCQRC